MCSRWVAECRAWYHSIAVWRCHDILPVGGQLPLKAAHAAPSSMGFLAKKTRFCKAGSGDQNESCAAISWQRHIVVIIQGACSKPIFVSVLIRANDAKWCHHDTLRLAGSNPSWLFFTYIIFGSHKNNCYNFSQSISYFLISLQRIIFRWFIYKISRTEAETMLLEKNNRNEFIQTDGAFLVRPSESTAGDFSLSVK